MAKSRNRKLADLIVTAGVDIAGNVTFDGGSTSADLTFADGDKANFGDASDLKLYHTANHSYIENGTGSLFIDAAQVNILDGANTAAAFTSAGATTLYNNGSPKLATTSTGINVTGITTSDTLVLEGTGVNTTYFTGGDASVAGRQLTLSSEAAGGQNNATHRLTVPSGYGSFNVTVNGKERVKVNNNGDVSFYNDASSNAVKMFWDASSERLAIGTTNPSTDLHLKNAASTQLLLESGNTDTGFLLFGDAQDLNVGSVSYSHSENSMRFETSDTERMRIDNNGHVGIGTDSPSTVHGNKVLQVSGTTGAEVVAHRPAHAALNDYIGGFLFYNGDTSGAPPHYSGMIAKASDTYGSSNLEFYAGRGALEDHTNATPHMIITGDSSDNSNVGIGTSSPYNKLHVNGTGRINSLIVGDASASNTPAVALHVKSSATNARLRIEDSDSSNDYWDFYVNQGDGLHFQEDGTNRVTFKTGGNVGIGTSDPQKYLHMQHGSTNAFTPSNDSWHSVIVHNNASAATNTAGIAFEVSGSAYHANAGTGIAAVKNGTNSDYGADLVFITRPQNAVAAERMRIDSSGNVGIGTTSPDRILEIEASVPAVRLTDTTTAGMYHEFVGDGNSLSIEADDGNVGASSSINFKVDGSEKVRIDVSGNLLVGKTSPSISTTGVELRPNGQVFATQSGNYPLLLNRTTSDGDIIQLRKDNTTVGSIGVISSSEDLYINATDDLVLQAGGNTGIAIFQSGGTLQNVTVYRHLLPSGTNDIGASGAQWRNLYLSGQNLVAGGALSAPSYSFIGDTNTGISRPTTHAVNIVTGGAERLRVDSSGNVGIGTTAPTNTDYGSVIPKLHVKQADTNGAFNLVARFEAGGDAEATGGAILINHSNDRGMLIEGGRDGSGSAADNDGVGHLGLLDNSGTHTRMITLRQNMVGASNVYNVGIGTTAPGAKLDLRGDMRLDGSAGTDRSIYFRNQGTTGGQVKSDKNLSLWAGNGSGTATQYLTIKEGGNVGIGTNNPGAKLHVQTSHTQTATDGANVNSTLNIANSGAGNGVYNAIKFAANQQDMYIMSFNNNQQADRRLGFFLGSVAGDATTDERLSILGDGNVGIGTTAPGFPLDVSASIGSTIGQTSTYNYGSNRNWAMRTNNYGSVNWGGWSLEQSTSNGGAPSVVRIGVHLNGNVGINMGGDASSGLTSINPATALHVGGDITVGSADAVGTGGTASIRFQNDNERSRITSNYASGGGGQMGFWTDSTGGTLLQRAYIENNGEFNFNGAIKMHSNYWATNDVLRAYSIGGPSTTSLTRTINVNTYWDFLAQGGAFMFMIHGWQSDAATGMVHWHNNGSGTQVITGVYLNEFHTASGLTVSVAKGTGDYDIDITLASTHSNTHGWYWKVWA